MVGKHFSRLYVDDITSTFKTSQPLYKKLLLQIRMRNRATRTTQGEVELEMNVTVNNDVIKMCNIFLLKHQKVIRK